MTFRLALKVEGPNYLYWQTLDQLIGLADVSYDPDAGFIPQGEVVEALSGKSVARGFATVSWHWNVLTLQQRAILKEFCPGASAEVYIETTTNEIDLYDDPIFIQALAIMHWPTGDEDIQGDKILGLEVTFTHLIEVP